jgi:DNA-binding response OmpR family regulator
MSLDPLSTEQAQNEPDKLIVIVEDEPDMAELFAEMMRLEGYRVRKVFGTAAAIDVIAQERPQAVLLDVMMPDLSGLEVVRYMRRDPDLEVVPVIIVSGRGSPQDIQAGMEAGATVYLVKPIGYADMQRALQKATNL